MTRSSVKTVFSAFWDTFLNNNVVLVQAIGICPILAVGYNLKYAVALSVCTAAVLIPVSLLLTVIGDRLANWLRPVVYTLLSAVLLFGAAFVLQRWVSAELYAKLYVFLPLMAVNTLFTYRAGNIRAALRPAVAVADALGSALGFALVLCVAGALREMAIAGSLWDIPLGYEARFPEAEHPFIGFVLLGFMAAALQWMRRLAHRLVRGKEEVESL